MSEWYSKHTKKELAALIDELEIAADKVAISVKAPTPEQVRSACLSYRHDFGLLSPEEQRSVEFVAREWLHAWRKEILR